MKRPALVLLAVLATLSTLVTACRAPRRSEHWTPATSPPPPRRRFDGPRLPPFAGGDPKALGFTRVGDLLWLEARDAAAWERGLIRSGDGYLSVAAADAAVKSPFEGYLLRTDHLVLSTNVSLARARELAQVAETHVGRVFAAMGEPLDLRYPADPIPMVVAARCAEFQCLLRERVALPVDWGAFYLALDGTVYACEERSDAGDLSVAADLRHELTHGILDLGRPERGRDAMYTRPHFWAWEAIALWSEHLGEAADQRARSPRLERFRRRLAWGELVPLSELFRLPQSSFVGRHYDQTAAFTEWLMDVDGGARRAGMLALVRRVMHGEAEVCDFDCLIGMSPPEAERRWLASLGHAPPCGR
jgi:hypothetical protein